MVGAGIHTHGRLAAALVAALVAAFGWSAPASAGETGQSRAEVLSYWTEERIRTARPADELLAGAKEDILHGLDLGLGAEPSTRATAQRVGKPKRKGNRTHGKVFFSQGLTDYVCSGTVVRSRTKSLVVTAGHCTHSQGLGYAENFMFVPAKDGSSEPYDRWTATRLKAMSQWQNNEDLRYDVAFATMGKRGGKRIQRVVGARRMAFNRSGNQNFKAFGYPAEGRFDGRTPYRCKAQQEGSDADFNEPRPNRIDCDMTGGSSGGGWVVKGKGGRVNSVVSYGYECTVILLPCANPDRGKLFGPYFGSQIKTLYRAEKK